MSHTLVIGYGAFGGNCARAYSKTSSQPVLLIENHVIEDIEDNFLIEHLAFGEDTTLNKTRLRNAMSGYDHILLLSSIGGDSFSMAYEVISECARIQKTTLVSLCTVPFVFESERRNRALGILPTLSQRMRNIFVIDLQKTILDDCNTTEFLDHTVSFISSTVMLLVRLLEQSPFFSLCSDNLYTISLGSGASYSEAVEQALEHPFFELTSYQGKVIICSSGSVSGYEIEQTQNSILTRFGTLPELLSYSGLDNSQVLLFIPIFYLSV